MYTAKKGIKPSLFTEKMKLYIKYPKEFPPLTLGINTVQFNKVAEYKIKHTKITRVPVHQG